ncbi:hypothetical protein BDN70DRAFT_884582 [Pholiota conissans]|uniref:VWFA domain-containing protein n=1 Tax=Pholiota conissans TaxID=109636 RepID=A0A9P6CQ40_9AGAR|nr:hypothetical protein BDN70DRAFT_884582 [Pholiota conissans]
MVTIPEPVQSSASSETLQDSSTPRNNRPLDIVFLQDTTGSQGSYIEAACKAIRDICDKISAAGQLDKALMRFGLVAFRDHPPQDRTYVTKNFGFTNDIEHMQKNLSSLKAEGGGDGPEAQTAALAAALNMPWTEKAVKMVILITDAPPHGLGELGDGFTASPDQNDPLIIARQMAERGITLFVIACEPTLSTHYKHAVDFYEALTEITSGQMFPLLLANQLGDYIIGTALETMETEKLVEEFEHIIIDDVYSKDMPVEKVAENLQQFMESKGTKINSVVVDDVYTKNETAMQNQQIWSNAGSLGEARKKVQVVREPRIMPQFLHTASTSPQMATASWAADPSGFRGGGFGRSAAYGGPLAGAAPTPTMYMQSQQVSRQQSQRIVMQSVARNSAVTPSGMFSKATGKAAPTMKNIDPMP